VYYTLYPKLGEIVTLPADAENKTITWSFNNNTIARKQPGGKTFVYDTNYRLMDNGDLIIQKMTLFLEGLYIRSVENDSLQIDVKVKGTRKTFYLRNFME
jgi:hypothetical protein